MRSLILILLGFANVVLGVNPGYMPLTEERILPVMHRALGVVEAEIEVLEMTRFPVPEGELEFALKDLTPPASPAASTRWRGWIHESGEKTFAIWAVVKIRANCTRIVAVEDLEVGRPIQESQLREESYLGFPFSKDALVTMGDLVGRAPLRTLRAGSAVRRDATTEPLAVTNGSDLVAEFRSGRIRVSAPVIALGSGRIGEVISVRNPLSKKIFSARIQAPRIVVVEMGQ